MHKRTGPIISAPPSTEIATRTHTQERKKKKKKGKKKERQ